MRGAAELAVGQLGEPPLDQVHPAGTRGCEVQVKAGVAQQPLFDFRGLVRGVVVTDQVQVQAAGDGGIDELEETQELLAAVPAVVLGDHRPAGHIHGGEQAGRAITHIVMGHPRRVVGRIGRQRAVRSRAWIWLFSSTARTRAFSGGSRYRFDGRDQVDPRQPGNKAGHALCACVQTSVAVSAALRAWLAASL